jgi:Predicted thioesterase involved in non-ribosomal peptide biosynthesis
MSSRFNSSSAGWFRIFRPRPGAQVRLICFPYAGSSASAFRGWADLLPDSIELVAVQYPGRQDRYNEAPVPELQALADEIVRAVDGLLDRPVAFFGHSLGATVAFEVARRLRPRFPSPLSRLFVSARKSPADCRPNGFDFRGNQGMKAYMRRLGGAAERAVDDDELWQLTMPVLRNDLLMSEGYSYLGGARLSSPITAISAELDVTCTLTDMQRWEDYTIGSFDAHMMPGGHFYIDTVPVELIALISQFLSPGSAPFIPMSG